MDYYYMFQAAKLTAKDMNVSADVFADLLKEKILKDPTAPQELKDRLIKDVALFR